MNATLPNWFWLCHHLFLLVTLITTILFVMKNIKKTLAILTLITVLFIPIASLTMFIGRPFHMTELDVLVMQLQNINVYAIMIVIGYLMTLSWWFNIFIMMNKLGKKNYNRQNSLK